MKPVVIESPFAGRHGHSCRCARCKADVKRNRKYLRDCILDCLHRGETPYASHEMLTRALRDAHPKERELGIAAGLDMAAMMCAQPMPGFRPGIANPGLGALHLFYIDLGFSPGMRHALNFAADNKHVSEERSLPRWRLSCRHCSIKLALSAKGKHEKFCAKATNESREYFAKHRRWPRRAA